MSIPPIIPSPSNLAPMKAESDGFSFTKALAVTLVALAAIGLVAAIFTGQMFAALGYGILGISAGVLWVEEAANDQWIQNMQMAMQRDVDLIQNANKKTAALTQELSKEEALMKTTTDALKSDIAKLTEQNFQFQSTQKALDVQIVQLKAENQHLTKSKEELSRNVESLRQTCSGIQSQVQQFLSLNLKMGQDLGAFQQAGGELGNTSRDLREAIGNLQKVDKDFASLGDQIALGNKAIQQILDFMSQQETKGKEELEKFQTLLESLHSAQSGLTTQTSTIETQKKALEERTQAFDQMTQKLSETEARLDRKQDAINQGILELKTQRELLQADLKKLQDNEAKSAKQIKVPMPNSQTEPPHEPAGRPVKLG